MSWWDYGYQITAMANRTILVDNNTWNNTHISRVGQVCLCDVFYVNLVGGMLAGERYSCNYLWYLFVGGWHE